MAKSCALVIRGGRKPAVVDCTSRIEDASPVQVLIPVGQITTPYAFAAIVMIKKFKARRMVLMLVFMVIR